MGIWTSLGAAALMTTALAACGGPPPADSGSGSTRMTAVPGRTAQLRNDQQALSGAVAAQSGQLDALRQSIGGETQAYNAAVGSINDRLQAGTTPANRELVERWNEAQAHLDKITADLGRLNALAAEVARQASVASSTLSAARTTATARTGRGPSRAIESETNRAVQDLNRLTGEIHSEITRQSNFLLAERPTLAALGYAVNAGRLGVVRTAGGPRR